jgi:hypothetical protein
VNGLNIFIIRIFLGAAFAVMLSRFFFPRADFIYAIGLGIILVGLAYFAEYLRKKRSG